MTILYVHIKEYEYLDANFIYFYENLDDNFIHFCGYHDDNFTYFYEYLDDNVPSTVIYSVQRLDISQNMFIEQHTTKPEMLHFHAYFKSQCHLPS